MKPVGPISDKSQHYRFLDVDRASIQARRNCPDISGNSILFSRTDCDSISPSAGRTNNMTTNDRGNKTINWGIIGPGHIAEKFASRLNRALLTRPAAMRSRAEMLSEGQSFAERHGAEKSTNHSEELCADPNVDIVYVATPHTAREAGTRLCHSCRESRPLRKSAPDPDPRALRILTGVCSSGECLTDGRHVDIIYAIPPVDSSAPAKWHRGEATDGSCKLWIPRYLTTLKAVYSTPNSPVEAYLMSESTPSPSRILDLFGERLPVEVKALANIGETGVDEQLAIICRFFGWRPCHFRLSDSHPNRYGPAESPEYRPGHCAAPETFWRSESLVVHNASGTTTEDHSFDVNGFEYEARAMGEAWRQNLTECPGFTHQDSRNIASLSRSSTQRNTARLSI